MNELLLADVVESLRGIRAELNQIAGSVKAIDLYFKALTDADELVKNMYGEEKKDIE